MQLHARYPFTVQTNTVDVVPPHSVQSWRKLLRETFAKYIDCSIAQDSAACRELLLYIMQLPSICLSHTPPRRHQSFHQHVQNNIQQALQQQSQLLHTMTAQPHTLHAQTPAVPSTNNISAGHTVSSTEFSSSSVHPQQRANIPSPNNSACDNDAVARKVQRCSNILFAGGTHFIQKAARTLAGDSTAQVAVNDATLQRLHTLHPSRYNNLSGNSSSSSSVAQQVPMSLPVADIPDSYNIDSAETDCIVKRLDHGARAGPSGWNAAMLSVCLQDEETSRGIALLTKDIINANVFTDPLSRQLLLSTTLIALDKQDGAGGVRPIAMGELFYKIAATYALSQINPAHMGQLFNRVQCGVGTAGGSDKAIHLINALRISGHSPNTSIVMKIDVRNAFNCLDRDANIRALIATAYATRPTWKLHQWAYNEEPTPLLVFHPELHHLMHVLLSSQGVKQGDTLASFNFALTAQPVYELIVDTFRNVSGVAVLDDFTLIGEYTAVFEALKLLKLELHKINLEVRLDKCEVLMPPAIRDASDRTIYYNIQRACAQHGMRLQEHSMELLGSMISWNDHDLTAFCVTKVKQLTTFLTRLHHDSGYLCAQSAFLLLRYCALSRMNYLARCMPPHVMTAAAMAFDEMLLHTLLKIMQIERSDMSEHALTQMRLRLRNGGLGLRQLQHVSAAAYLSSLAQIIPHINQQSFPNRPSTQRWLVNEMHTHAIEIVRDNRISEVQLMELQLTPELLRAAICIDQPATDAALAHPYIHLQHRITDMTDQTAFDKLLNTFKAQVRSHGVSDYARLISCSSRHANRWLTVSPHIESYRMSSMEFQMAVRLLLGLSPDVAFKHQRCVCRAGNVSFDLEPMHLLTCKKLAYGATLLRHNATAFSFARVLQSSLHVPVEMETVIPAKVNTVVPATATNSTSSSNSSSMQQAAETEHTHYSLNHPTAPLASLVIHRRPIERVNTSARQRTDVTFYLHHYCITVDFTVVSASSTSNNGKPVLVDAGREAANGRMFTFEDMNAIEHAALLKIGKHRNSSRRLNMSFYPFVLEQHGRLGHDAHELIKLIAKHTPSLNNSTNAGMMVNHLYNLLSVTLQRGNAIKIYRSAQAWMQQQHQRDDDWLPNSNQQHHSSPSRRSPRIATGAATAAVQQDGELQRLFDGILDSLAFEYWQALVNSNQQLEQELQMADTTEDVDGPESSNSGMQISQQ